MRAPSRPPPKTTAIAAGRASYRAAGLPEFVVG